MEILENILYLELLCKYIWYPNNKSELVRFKCIYYLYIQSTASIKNSDYKNTCKLVYLALSFDLIIDVITCYKIMIVKDCVTS